MSVPVSSCVFGHGRGAEICRSYEITGTAPLRPVIYCSVVYLICSFLPTKLYHSVE